MACRIKQPMADSHKPKECGDTAWCTPEFQLSGGQQACCMSVLAWDLAIRRLLRVAVSDSGLSSEQVGRCTLRASCEMWHSVCTPTGLGSVRSTLRSLTRVQELDWRVGGDTASTATIGRACVGEGIARMRVREPSRFMCAAETCSGWSQSEGSTRRARF